MTKRASILRVLSWMLLLLVFIAAANLLSIRRYGARGYALNVGARFDPELQFLDGVFQPEQDENNTTYRWSQAQSTFSLRGFVPVPDPVLSLVIGGVPASAGHAGFLPVWVVAGDAACITSGGALRRWPWSCGARLRCALVRCAPR